VCQSSLSLHFVNTLRCILQLFQGYIPAVQKLREGATEGAPVFKVGIDNGNHLITSFPDHKNIHRQLNKYLCDQKRERIRKQLLEKDVNLAAAFISSHSVKHIVKANAGKPSNRLNEWEFSTMISTMLGTPVNMDLVLQQPNGTSLLAGECKCRHCGKIIDPQCRHAFECSNMLLKGARTAQSSDVKHALKSSVDTMSLEHTNGGAITIGNEPICKNHLTPKNPDVMMPASSMTAWRHGPEHGKRADVSITYNQGPIKGPRKVLGDISGIHPTYTNCRTDEIASRVGFAASAREEEKLNHYKPYFHVEQGQLVGLGFETHGALGKEFMKTTGQLAKAICFNPMSNSVYKRYGVIPVTASSQATYLIRQQIVIAIFRGNANLLDRFATHCYPRVQQRVRTESEEFVE